MGDFKEPTALLEKSRGISLVLVACPISYALVTPIPADEEPLWKCCCVCRYYDDEGEDEDGDDDDDDEQDQKFCKPTTPGPRCSQHAYAFTVMIC